MCVAQRGTSVVDDRLSLSFSPQPSWFSFFSFILSKVKRVSERLMKLFVSVWVCLWGSAVAATLWLWRQMVFSQVSSPGQKQQKQPLLLENQLKVSEFEPQRNLNLSLSRDTEKSLQLLLLHLVTSFYRATQTETWDFNTDRYNHHQVKIKH